MMATSGSGVWVLEMFKDGKWQFCNVYSDVVKGQEEAPAFRSAFSDTPIRWDNAAYSSQGFYGEASVPAFKLRLVVIQ